MPLTNNDKARLATELCGLERWECKAGDLYLQGKDGPFVCDVDDFDPVDNAEQAMLVLEGLVKKLARERKQSKACTLTKLLRGWIDQFSDSDEIDLGPAVCTAGLEVLNQKGCG